MVAGLLQAEISPESDFLDYKLGHMLGEAMACKIKQMSGTRTEDKCL